MAYDWRPPTDADWRRLRTLLRDVMVHLEGDADMFDQAEQDLRAIGGDKWAIGLGRYPDRAEMCRVLASWVEDECRALHETAVTSARSSSTTAACSPAR
jgi:hypothetical protein